MNKQAILEEIKNEVFLIGEWQAKWIIFPSEEL
jgi:hypothetical protein